MTIPSDVPADGDAESATKLREFANELVEKRRRASPRSIELLGAHAHNWRLERMAVIDRLVLRVAVCELLTHPETPPKVVINEALELARTFSGDESVAFVNGVLDAVRKALAAGGDGDNGIQHEDTE